MIMVVMMLLIKEWVHFQWVFSHIAVKYVLGIILMSGILALKVKARCFILNFHISLHEGSLRGSRTQVLVLILMSEIGIL